MALSNQETVLCYHLNVTKPCSRHFDSSCVNNPFGAKELGYVSSSGIPDLLVAWSRIATSLLRCSQSADGSGKTWEKR